MDELKLKDDLASIDALRERDPEAALKRYAALKPSDVAACTERLRWIFSCPKAPGVEELLPLAEYVTDHGDCLSRRQALHMRANWHWGRAEVEPAESLWSEAVLLGRPERDSLWIACAVNLSIVLNAMGRTVESLVLVGATSRVAEIRGERFFTALALVRRGNLLIQFGDLDAAERALTKVEGLLSGIEPEARRGMVAVSEALAWARLRRATGEHELALEAQLRHIALVSAKEPANDPHVVGSHCTRLKIEYELYEDRRDELMDELERIPETYAIEGNWMIAWRYEWLQMRLKQGLADGQNRDNALQRARELMEFLVENTEDTLLVGYASDLGKLFNDELDAATDSHDAYEVAAGAALRRIVSVASALKDLPEMMDVTSEDLEVISGYRRRMEEKHAALFQAISDLWRRGHPAVSLVQAPGELIQACAWCTRIKMGTEWTPVSHFIPPSSDFPVSHGVCPRCRSQVDRIESTVGR